MKRKGFTLVELLIVVAILGVLSATMMVTATGSTVNSKAMTIANNIRSCKSAALLYCQTNGTGIGDVTAKVSDVLKAHVNAWADFNSSTATIKYTVSDDTSTTNDKWGIKVDFSSDTEHEAISTKLQAIPGFSSVGDSGVFTVNLWDGTIINR